MNDTDLHEASNIQQQNVKDAVDLLLAVIDESTGTDEEKVAAKSKVASLLHGAISAVAEGGARAMIERFKA